MSVLFPEPLDPTRAVVVPAFARKVMSLSTGMPSRYSNQTCSNATSPSMRASGWRVASSSSSVGVSKISRMRSSPAKASVICVPMLAICTTGNATRPTKKIYEMRSPSVISPRATARPPIVRISTPTAPMMMVETAAIALVPVIVDAMLRKSRWTPRVKTISSRFSAV